MRGNRVADLFVIKISGEATVAFLKSTMKKMETRGIGTTELTLYDVFLPFSENLQGLMLDNAHLLDSHRTLSDVFLLQESKSSAYRCRKTSFP